MGLRSAATSILTPSLVSTSLSEVRGSYSTLGASSSVLISSPLPAWTRPLLALLLTSCLAALTWAAIKMYYYPGRPRGKEGGFEVLRNPNTNVTDGLLQWVFPLIIPVGDMVGGDVEGVRRKVKSLSEMGWKSGVERLGLRVEEGMVEVGGKAVSYLKADYEKSDYEEDGGGKGDGRKVRRGE